MAYTDQTIHSGTQSAGLSTKNAVDLATALNAINDSIVAGGTVDDAAAATAAALTGTLTGTVDNILADIGDTTSVDGSAAVNKNFKEIQDEVTKLIADIASIRTAVNAVIATLA